MREMRGEVGKKPLKKRWIIPHFYDIAWLIFEYFSPLRLLLKLIGGKGWTLLN